MPEERVPEEEIKSEQSGHESEDTETTTVSRRDFLLGAGAGIVVSAAGAAGAFAIARPKTEPAAPAPAAAPAQSQAPAQSGPASAPAGGQASVIGPDQPASMRTVTLNIDGKNYLVNTDVRNSLWEVMTYQLGMSNSNVGCDRAQCGACAVVVDGRAMNACTLLAARLGRGQKIVTVDGISKGTSMEALHPVAKAFHQEGGYQCGICTRGFIMSTYALLSRNPTPNEAEVREALSGNICRCSEYPKIFESVFRAAEEMRKTKA